MRYITTLAACVTAFAAPTGLFSAPATAAVTAYYRFEPGTVLDDSSGNGRTLTDTTGIFGSGQVALPADFLNPVPPITGVANDAAVSSPSMGSLTAIDHADWSSSALTIEAMIRPTAASGTHAIASHWDATGDQRGWLLAVVSNHLEFRYTGLGTNAILTEQAFSDINPNNSYYVATTFTLGDSVATDGRNITGRLYLQDLTSGGPLLYQDFTTAPGFMSLFDSTAPLAIGSTGNAGARFAGVLDEVRISNAEVPVESLYAYHPDLEVIQPTLVNVQMSDTNNGDINSFSITRNGATTTYQPSDFMGATLVSFAGAVVTTGGTPSQSVELLMPPDTEVGDLPAGAERHNILGDLSGATGFILGPTADTGMSFTVEFGQDLTNRPGPDIILLDYGSPDRVDIEINGVLMDDVIPTTTNAGDTGIALGTRFLSDGDVTSLGDLESATFSVNATTPTTSSNFSTFGIDLSDYGLTEGSTLLAGTPLIFTDAIGLDAVGVFGLFEPVVDVGLQGDFNNDGVVDAADYTVWRNNLGASDETALNNLGDGLNGVDVEDYNLWKTHFGTTSQGAASHLVGSPAAVPEPGTVVLWGWGAVVIGLIARRGSRS